MTDSVAGSKSVDQAVTQLFGYEVVDFLGEGAGSFIYAVSDPTTKQVFALKHVIVKTEKQLRFAEQLINEYEVAKQINHPMVRRVFDMKVNRTLLRKITDAALVMELFDGTPLDQRPAGTNLVELLGIFSKVAQGLGGIHAAGFVHCDLKPNNILVGADGSVKLIDLGQACPALTTKQRIQGTPDYISPEQVKLEPVTYRTDIFNFGATLYWALCGKALPTLFTLKKGENSILWDQGMASPHDVNPSVPVPISNLVMECVRTNPEKRPADTAELVRRLELMAMAAARTGEAPAGQ